MRTAVGGRLYFDQFKHSELMFAHYDKSEMFYALTKPMMKYGSLSYFCALDVDGRRNIIGTTLSSGQLSNP